MDLDKLNTVLLLKENGPPFSRKGNEIDMSTASSGLFGILLVCSKIIENATPGDHSTPNFTKSGYFDASGIRVHTIRLLATKCNSLENAKGPKQLINTIVHAMIGYHNAFFAGWLQGDISISSVSTIQEPRPLECLDCEQEVALSFFADGDQAVEWKESRMGILHGSGTLPFMSIKSLENWDVDPNALVKPMHTAIDDLESFLSLLV